MQPVENAAAGSYYVTKVPFLDDVDGFLRYEAGSLFFSIFMAHHR